MTKEDWKKVEAALSGTYGIAKIKADEFEVTFQRALVSKNRLGIGIYVNGWMKGEWYDPEKEFPEQRCLRLVSKFACKPKTRAELKKLGKTLGKKMTREMGPAFDPDLKYHYYELTWPSVTAIRRHYQQTFQSLELIEVLGC